MYDYKTGDVCPFCGKPITTTDPELLEIISRAAAYLDLPAPDEPLPDYRCSIRNCPREGNGSMRAHCCQSCDARLTCPNVCYNRPSRCGCATKVKTNEEAN